MYFVGRTIQKVFSGYRMTSARNDETAKRIATTIVERKIKRSVPRRV